LIDFITDINLKDSKKEKEKYLKPLDGSKISKCLIIICTGIAHDGQAASSQTRVMMIYTMTHKSK
jgi:hypothetical protein